MAAGWAFQAWRNNGGWTDVFWTFSTGLVGATAALANYVVLGNPVPVALRTVK